MKSLPFRTQQPLTTAVVALVLLFGAFAVISLVVSTDAISMEAVHSRCHTTMHDPHLQVVMASAPPPARAPDPPFDHRFLCFCGDPALVFTCSKPYKQGRRAPNFGRQAARCYRDLCGYFHFVDEPLRDAEKTSECGLPHSLVNKPNKKENRPSGPRFQLKRKLDTRELLPDKPQPLKRFQIGCRRCGANMTYTFHDLREDPPDDQIVVCMRCHERLNHDDRADDEEASEMRPPSPTAAGGGGAAAANGKTQ